MPKGRTVTGKFYKNNALSKIKKNIGIANMQLSIEAHAL